MLSNRLTDHRGLHLSKTQHSSIPEGLKHEYVIIPSTSAPSWGGYFVIDIREKHCNLHDVVLQFNVTALTYSTTTSNPRYTPASFWPLRIEFVQNNNVIDTVYSNEQFICTQLFNFDEQRKLINVAMGQYDNNTQRQTLASAANAYYVDLSTYFQQTIFHYLTIIQIFRLGFIWILWPTMLLQTGQLVHQFQPLTLVMLFVSFQECQVITLLL